MQITIDNLDGRGAVSYTGAVVPQGPITIKRTLNEPSTCTVELLPEVLGLSVPGRRARVVVMADDTSTLFTGYLPVEPTRVYVGFTSTGAVYKLRLAAVSDEWLLDRLGPSVATSGLTQDAGVLLEQLTNRTNSGNAVLAVEAAASLRTTGAIASNTEAPWSVNARQAASAGYAGYRALGGQVAVPSVPIRTHSLREGDATLTPASFTVKAIRELANDVTLSGGEEPAAYITEVFQADGANAQFTLNDSAFGFAQQTVLRDGFEDAALTTARWEIADPGGHLAVGEDGFTFNGGTGGDGQTLLTALNAVELGGTIVAELSGVIVHSGSDGVLAGLYTGEPILANCFAGFRVGQNTTATSSETVLVPLFNGAEAGSSFPVVEGRAYTLRMRLYCRENYRIAQRYYCMADGVVQGFGSTSAEGAAMQALMEVVDESPTADAAATVLFDSAAAGTMVASAPAVCRFVMVNATQMFGSVRGVRLEKPGSVWVVSVLPSGAQITRSTGSAGAGVDCEVRYGSQSGSPGSVTFLPGHVPVSGERVFVSYAGQRRAVARLADAASVAGELAAGAAGTSRWLGKVLEPPARTSADCESAAQAVLAMATSRAAAMAGRYAWLNPPEDVWPGDLLEVTSAGDSLSLLVRRVAITDGGATPEVRSYELEFANDWATEWADGFGVRLSDKIAADAVLPERAANVPGAVLANLPQLAIRELSGDALQIDAGAVPPAGGGFEVRRADWAFGPGTGGTDLVLRSPVPLFSIPRSSSSERFYVRMYDGSTPPVYSRFSSALFVHVPAA